jgi:UDP-2-acetamido-2-deoxy-ribo-hexuluronate aminotransferase
VTAAPLPFFAAEREWAALGDELLDAMGAALAGGRSLQGEAVGVFESELATWTGRRHAVAVGSGTDALTFALVAGGVGPGDDVLVPAFSFIASASCVLRAGARPVFVDVDEDGLLDLDDAAARATPRTRALVAVQLFGQMLDPAALEAFAAGRGLLLVEDAAQALGATHAERRCGAVGHTSACSFDPTKTLASPGSGGALLCDDEELAERARRLRWHGRDARGRFATLGHNSQLPTAAAAALRVKLRHQDGWARRRRAIASRYTAAIAGVPVAPPRVRRGGSHIFHKYVVRARDRDGLREHLRAAGVPTLVHYTSGLHREPVFAACQPGACPAADRLAGEVCSLPIHPFLDDVEVERVARALASFA